MPRKKIDIKDKKLFLNFVYLSDEEHSSLCELLGKEKTTFYIEELNGALGQHGYKYDSHYWTIRNWARRAASNSKSKTQNPELAARLAADRVIEALKDPANKFRPAFEERIRQAVHAVCLARKQNWFDLRALRDDPEEIDKLRIALIEDLSK